MYLHFPIVYLEHVDISQAVAVYAFNTSTGQAARGRSL